MRFPVFGIGQQGKSPNVTAQSRINMYLDMQPQEDKTQISLHPRPGLSLFHDFGDGPIRGMIAVNTLLYVVHGGTFWEINNAGTATSRGTLNTTSGRVGMAYNQSGVVAIQDGTNGYFYTIATTTLAVITDADHIDTAVDVVYHDGYFIYVSPDTAQFFISTADATDETNMIDALDFASAEKSADNLRRVIDNTTEILLLGEDSIEMWNDTGAADFPYERTPGGVIELGLEALWSPARFAESSYCMLAVNRKQGQVKVIRIEGFQYITISNPEFETVINKYTTSDATGLSYVHEGHPFYQLNFPTDGKSWLYDGLTNLWSEVSYAATGARHRGEISSNFLSKSYVSDYENGKLYKQSADLYADNGVSFAREVTSRHIFDEKQVRIARLWADVEAGVGLSGASDPNLVLTISKDGGHTWGREKEASMGAIGEYGKRMIYRRLGRGYDWLFRLRCTDPVKTVFVGAYVDTV